MASRAVGYLGHRDALYRALAMTLAFLLVLLAANCAPPVRQSTSTAFPTSPPAPSQAPAGDQPDNVIKQSTESLAKALRLGVDQVTLVSMQRQDFPDAALGCAQPGESAAAVITPGYRVVLGVGDSLYELHTNLNGTMVRCLPTEEAVVGLPNLTPVTPTGSPVAPSTPSPAATPDDGIDKTQVQVVGAALKTKDYARLQEAMSENFWLGFYASEAGQVTPEDAIEKLQELYLEPGLVRVYPQVSVEKLLPDWTSAAPYARFVYSSGWGESQKDDAILLFSEQGNALYWAGLFYVFDGLKETAYGDNAGQLPPSPAESLGAMAAAIESKDYAALKALATTPAFLGFYRSEASQLSPEAFVEGVKEYLEPGEVKVRLDVDVVRLLPDWTVEPPCDDVLYSTGWGEDQTDDGILCLRDEAGKLRWGGLLYIFSHLKENAYAEPVPSAEKETPQIEGMVYIPPGPFLRGSSASDIGSVQAQCVSLDAGCQVGQFEDEGPQREITLSGFYIDQTEVTVAQFKAFVAATGYQTTSEAKGDAIQYTWRSFDTPERQNHPVRWMSWHDANAYCQWAGKRLPTEAEWEKAARGAEGLIFPWGNVWDQTRVPQGDTAAVDAFPNGASPYGVLGMAGGVWEWVADWYDSFYYQASPAADPPGPGQTRDKVLRGGAFGNVFWKLRATHRHFGGADGYSQDHGFRCARDE